MSYVDLCQFLVYSLDINSSLRYCKCLLLVSHLFVNFPVVSFVEQKSLILMKILSILTLRFVFFKSYLRTTSLSRVYIIYTALTVSHKFCNVVFSFSFVSKYFLISLVTSSLIHWLLKSVLFNFHNMVNFSAFHLLLISNCILLWSQKTPGKHCFIMLHSCITTYCTGIAVLALLWLFGTEPSISLRCACTLYDVCLF